MDSHFGIHPSSIDHQTDQTARLPLTFTLRDLLKQPLRWSSASDHLLPPRHHHRPAHRRSRPRLLTANSAPRAGPTETPTSSVWTRTASCSLATRKARTFARLRRKGTKGRAPRAGSVMFAVLDLADSNSGMMADERSLSTSTNGECSSCEQKRHKRPRPGREIAILPTRVDRLPQALTDLTLHTPLSTSD